MKTLLHNNLFIRLGKPLIRIMIITLLICDVQSGFALPNVNMHADDTIIVSKSQGNKKYKIKIYPNVTHEVLFFTATGEEDKIYQLFIFDVEGKLVKQTMVRNRQTGFLSKLKTGNYSYEVFSNDERIENGSVIVK